MKQEEWYAQKRLDVLFQKFFKAGNNTLAERVADIFRMIAKKAYIKHPQPGDWMDREAYLRDLYKQCLQKYEKSVKIPTKPCQN